MKMLQTSLVFLGSGREEGEQAIASQSDQLELDEIMYGVNVGRLLIFDLLDQKSVHSSSAVLILLLDQVTLG